MPRSSAPDLGLCCLPMSHRKDAMLIWVKQEGQGSEWEYLFGYAKISHIFEICLIVLGG